MLQCKRGHGRAGEYADQTLKLHISAEARSTHDQTSQQRAVSLCLAFPLSCAGHSLIRTDAVLSVGE